MELYTLNEVSKYYERWNIRTREKNINYVIKNLNLTIKDNEFIVVVGKSGIGKTTVIEQCIQESRYKFGNNYYFKFTANKYDNLKAVVNVILFLFFPYVYLEEITFNYLNDMDIDNGLKILLINLINNVIFTK